MNENRKQMRKYLYKNDKETEKRKEKLRDKKQRLQIKKCN